MKILLNHFITRHVNTCGTLVSYHKAGDHPTRNKYNKSNKIQCLKPCKSCDNFSSLARIHRRRTSIYQLALVCLSFCSTFRLTSIVRCSASQLGQLGFKLHALNVHFIIDNGYPAQSQTNSAWSPSCTN